MSSSSSYFNYIYCRICEYTTTMATMAGFCCSFSLKSLVWLYLARCCARCSTDNIMSSYTRSSSSQLRATQMLSNANYLSQLWKMFIHSLQSILYVVSRSTLRMVNDFMFIKFHHCIPSNVEEIGKWKNFDSISTCCWWLPFPTSKFHQSLYKLEFLFFCSKMSSFPLYSL